MAPNQEKPHTTPLHSLIYSIYISVVGIAAGLTLKHVSLSNQKGVGISSILHTVGMEDAIKDPEFPS